MRQAKYEQALEFYAETARRGGAAQDWREYVSMAESLGRLQNVVEALEGKINNGQGVEPFDYERLAYFVRQAGDTNRFHHVVRAGLDHFPNADSLREMGAYELANETRYNEAADLLSKHGSLTNSVALSFQFLSWLVQGEAFDRAEHFMGRVTPAVKSESSMLELAARIAETRGRRVDALLAFQTLAKRQPGEVRYAVNTARLLMELGRSREAKTVLEPLAHLNTPEVLRGLARIYAAGGDYQKAERIQRELLARPESQTPQAWGFLGDILLSRGNKAEAKLAYEKAVQLALQEAQVDGEPAGGGR
jgi:tetratricopeptide (TPR) repeat protein